MNTWIPTEWTMEKDFNNMDAHDTITIHLMNSPSYDGNRYAARNGRLVLAKDLEWEIEPSPSNRDDAFYERCRFKTFEEAINAIAKVQVKK